MAPCPLESGPSPRPLVGRCRQRETGGSDPSVPRRDSRAPKTKMCRAPPKASCGFASVQKYDTPPVGCHGRLPSNGRGLERETVWAPTCPVGRFNQFILCRHNEALIKHGYFANACCTRLPSSINHVSALPSKFRVFNSRCSGIALCKVSVQLVDGSGPVAFPCSMLTLDCRIAAAHYTGFSVTCMPGD